MKERMSGILIHPTSFPGPYGCGDLGEGAYKVVDWLKSAGQRILQVLSIGPTGYGDSPYANFSSFAGNPYFISFDKLVERGYLSKEDFTNYHRVDPGRVDFGALYNDNFPLLRKAYHNYLAGAGDPAFREFCEENAGWLTDYALFMALKESYRGATWDNWAPELKLRTDLSGLSEEVRESAGFHRFVQWQFDLQWREFKSYANAAGLKIIGDVPFNVQYDSSDVWVDQELFHLDDKRRPSVVAGVPPDFFTETGQYWGNPCYNWEAMEREKFRWWKNRFRHLFRYVDVIKIDHFRGFEAYWSIPASEETAVNGQWIKSPGYELFAELKREFGGSLKELFIAEDLGVITDEVKALREAYGIPGMKIFEMGNFEAVEDPSLTEKEDADSFFKTEYLPDHYEENCVAYPGTHDNEVIRGWFENQPPERKELIGRYLALEDVKNLPIEKICDAVVDRVMGSKAREVIFQLQDVLCLEAGSRINSPGTLGSHNWTWRLREEQLTPERAENLKSLTAMNDRLEKKS